MKPDLHLIQLENVPIFDQLQLEEALLRADDRSFLIVNRGSPPAIVMGISSVPETLLNPQKLISDPIPVIKRFSGGGTVVIDPGTLFITFIFSKDHLDIPTFPEPIHRWIADLYTESWQIPGFRLQENDYCIGKRKCGGNAQYIKKGRFLHHTSFLFDYCESRMEYLLLPPKRPCYRQDRSHNDFLCRLRDYIQDTNHLIDKLLNELVKRFYIREFDPEKWSAAPHRQETRHILLPPQTYRSCSQIRPFSVYE